MTPNRAPSSPLLKLALVGILFTICLMECASGIVVRLGDAGALYQSSIHHEVDIAPVRFLPRLLTTTAATQSQRWKYPALHPLSLPLAYVVRQLPFLASYSQHSPHPTSQNTPSPPPQQAPAAPSIPRDRSWADHSPLPYYPLSPPSQDNLNIRRNQQPRVNLQYHQEVQLPRVQHQSEIVRLPSPVVKKVVMVSKEKNVAGRPGIDYPTYDDIPQTSFSCKDQRYKGFFGDPETRCQAWHYCDFNGGQASFLCPNGTIFSQVLFTCDWWFNVQCNSTTQAYVINERLYKYIIPMAPSFPEDFQGPEVNQYLTLKFMELMQKEQKKLKEKMKENAKNKKPQDLDELELNLGDDELLSRHYLLQALSNDLGAKEGGEVPETKSTLLSQ